MCRQYATQDIYIRCASLLQPRFLLSPTSFRGRRDLRYRTMDRYREKTSTLLTRLAYGLSRKLSRPTVGRSPTTQAGPSETTGRSPETQTSPSATVDRSPATQTSPSATSRVGSLRRMLIYFIPFLQFSNFQMNSSFPFSLTSPRPAPLRSLCQVPHAVQCNPVLLPRSAGAVSTAIEHDV